jgi:hypothetical protein
MRHDLGDSWFGGILWPNVSDNHILHEGDPIDVLYHHHDLQSVAIALKQTHRDIHDLAEDVVKDTKGFLLNIVLDQVLLILRTSSGISNARRQSGLEEVV